MNEMSKQCFALMFPFSICRVRGGEERNPEHSTSETPLEDRRSGVQMGELRRQEQHKPFYPSVFQGDSMEEAEDQTLTNPLWFIPQERAGNNSSDSDRVLSYTHKNSLLTS